MENRYFIIEETYKGIYENKEFIESREVFKGNKQEIDAYLLDFVNKQLNQFSNFSIFINVDDILDGAFLRTSSGKDTIHIFKIRTQKLLSE